jgi:hypothetical protein
LSRKSLKSILVILITALYYIYFFFNCMIIPYPPVYDNYIMCNDKKNVFNISEYEEKPFASVETDEQNKQLPSGNNDRGFPAVAPESAVQARKTLPDGDEQLVQYTPDITGQSFRISPDSAGSKTLSPRDAVGQHGEAGLESTRQRDSRVLLSGSKTVKALSALSLKDKLWLFSILSRCSMEELLRITALLEDGVTYQENLEMYRVLRQRVTDDEQKRLDTLIEAYTK